MFFLADLLDTARFGEYKLTNFKNGTNNNAMLIITLYLHNLNFLTHN